MRLSFRSLVLVSLLSVSCLVHADDKAIQKALTANYARIDRAFLKNDVSGFSRMLSPDYTAIQPNGNKMTTAEMVAKFQRQHSTLKGAAMQTKIVGMTVKGNEATASVQESVSGVMSDPRNKAPHNWVLVTGSKDTWVKKDGVWKLKIYQIVNETTTVDGKQLGGTSGGPGKSGKVHPRVK